VKKIIGGLRLMRPANIVTAIADILAGVAISGYMLHEYSLSSILWLVLSTIGLYGGGVVLNDVFDAELDKVERPERPIPSGIFSVMEGGLLGSILLGIGIIAAWQVSMISGILAMAITIAAVVYDKWGKHHSFLGPLNMGLCRGLNLLLGMSIVPMAVSNYWFFSLIPIMYVAAITMISRGEVHGGNKNVLYGAASLYALVMISILFVSFKNLALLPTCVFVALWAFVVFSALKNAINQPVGKLIGKAVKAGVIALIIMNAAWASAFGLTFMALVIIGLLPVSILLAKVFAVT
jgi:4-hydroxybenzoate polyprenyltransferase